MLTLDAQLAASASVTRLVCGPDFVVAAGLCGRLRAWQAPRPRARVSLGAAGGARVAVGLVFEEAAGPWTLVLDESSLYDLANDHKATHAYRYVSAVAPDGRFAVALTDGTPSGAKKEGEEGGEGEGDKEEKK